MFSRIKQAYRDARARDREFQIAAETQYAAMRPREIELIRAKQAASGEILSPEFRSFHEQTIANEARRKQELRERFRFVGQALFA